MSGNLFNDPRNSISSHDATKRKEESNDRQLAEVLEYTDTTTPPNGCPG